MMRRFRKQMRRGMNPNVPPILQEANALFDKGEFVEAAGLFEQIGATAEARGGPRAPMFFLQAGRAYIFANQNTKGLDLLKRALNLLAARGQIQHLYKSGMRVSYELNQRGLKNEADQIQTLLKSLIPNFQSQSAETSAPKRPTLPTHCPSCGAAVRPDEVDWLDDVTAECAYCGSPVRDE